MFQVGHLERMPLGTPYPQVVERVREMVQDEKIRGRCALAVDSTGLGGARGGSVAGGRVGVRSLGGDDHGKRARERQWRRVNVPKRDLIAGVQILLEQGELRITRDLREAGALVRGRKLVE